MARRAKFGWKLMEMTGMGGNGRKWLEMTGIGWNWLEMTENGWNG